MADLNESHQFWVGIWVSGNNDPKSLFEQGHWMEMCRCITEKRAEEIAKALSFLHPQGVQVARMVEDEHGKRWQGYKYLPPESKDNQ